MDTKLDYLKYMKKEDLDELKKAVLIARDGDSVVISYGVFGRPLKKYITDSDLKLAESGNLDIADLRIGKYCDIEIKFNIEGRGLIETCTVLNSNSSPDYHVISVNISKEQHTPPMSFKQVNVIGDIFAVLCEVIDTIASEWKVKIWKNTIDHRFKVSVNRNCNENKKSIKYLEDYNKMEKELNDVEYTSGIPYAIEYNVDSIIALITKSFCRRILFEWAIPDPSGKDRGNIKIASMKIEIHYINGRNFIFIETKDSFDKQHNFVDRCQVPVYFIDTDANDTNGYDWTADFIETLQNIFGSIYKYGKKLSDTVLLRYKYKPNL